LAGVPFLKARRYVRDLFRILSPSQKTAQFFAQFSPFLQLRSTGYAPSKMQKLTKNGPVFVTGEDPETSSNAQSLKAPINTAIHTNPLAREERKSRYSKTTKPGLPFLSFHVQRYFIPVRCFNFV
jgi:hypothetical protein